MRQTCTSAIGFLKRLGACTRGATAVEYGLIIALIVIGIISVVSTVGGQTGRMWGNMATKVSAVTPSA